MTPTTYTTDWRDTPERAAWLKDVEARLNAANLYPGDDREWFSDAQVARTTEDRDMWEEDWTIDRADDPRLSAESDDTNARRIAALPDPTLQRWAQAAVDMMPGAFREHSYGRADDMRTVQLRAVKAAEAYGAGDRAAIDAFSDLFARVFESYHPDHRPKLPELEAESAEHKPKRRPVERGRLAACGRPLPAGARPDARYCSCRECKRIKMAEYRAAKRASGGQPEPDDGAPS